jgi:hypothetical protein
VAKRANSGGNGGTKPRPKNKPEKRPQKVVIGGWLSKADGDAFHAYALEIGIDSAALATLLITRELRQRRMADILDPEALTVVRKERRISARTAQAKLKARFVEHAAMHGISSDGAAAAIFRAELREKWLGKCLG